MTETFDVGYRLTPNNIEEFFVLDCMGKEVACFSNMGGAYIAPNAEMAALDFASSRGGQPNWLPSLRQYCENKSRIICDLYSY